METIRADAPRRVVTDLLLRVLQPAPKSFPDASYGEFQKVMQRLSGLNPSLL